MHDADKSLFQFSTHEFNYSGNPPCAHILGLLESSFPMSFTSDLGLVDNNISRGIFNIGKPTGAVLPIFLYK